MLRIRHSPPKNAPVHTKIPPKKQKGGSPMFHLFEVPPVVGRVLQPQERVHAAVHCAPYSGHCSHSQSQDDTASRRKGKRRAGSRYCMFLRQRACGTHPSVRPGAIQCEREGTAQRWIHSRELHRTELTQSRGGKAPGRRWISRGSKNQNVKMQTPPKKGKRSKKPDTPAVPGTDHWYQCDGNSAPVTLMS